MKTEGKKKKSVELTSPCSFLCLETETRQMLLLLLAIVCFAPSVRGEFVDFKMIALEHSVSADDMVLFKKMKGTDETTPNLHTL